MAETVGIASGAADGGAGMVDRATDRSFRTAALGSEVFRNNACGDEALSIEDLSARLGISGADEEAIMRAVTNIGRISGSSGLLNVA